MREARVGVVVAGLVLALAGCGGSQSVLRPESKQAHSIATLWWIMLAGCLAGFAVVVFLLFRGWRARTRTALPEGGDRTAVTLVVVLGVAVPIVLLSTLFVYSDVFVLKTVAAPDPRSTALTIDVVGKQWFWEARYPGTTAVTANEIHIPTRTRVNVVATTADVIHSFWVPRLNRKIDMIPGRANRVLLYADEPGRYRGQCAEFCGLQHAHMALVVVAQPPAAFRAWLRDQSRPAAHGLTLFTERCGGCHRIRGTAAQGRVGPDLTHLASRQTLAALTIPNTRDRLREWIRDPQGVKPGAKMPGLPLSDADLDAIVAYLESLR